VPALKTIGLAKINASFTRKVVGMLAEVEERSGS
jgi:hypothetical protein